VALAFGWMAQPTIRAAAKAPEPAPALTRPPVQQSQAAVTAVTMAAVVQAVLAAALTRRHAIGGRAEPPPWLQRPQLLPPAFSW
tara:strand:- start:658 stop:909 length:252 start_codon:yes stop_codon:yes gene_type:complete